MQYLDILGRVLTALDFNWNVASSLLEFHLRKFYSLESFGEYNQSNAKQSSVCFMCHPWIVQIMYHLWCVSWGFNNNWAWVGHGLVSSVRQTIIQTAVNKVPRSNLNQLWSSTPFHIVFARSKIEIFFSSVWSAAVSWQYHACVLTREVVEVSSSTLHHLQVMFRRRSPEISLYITQLLPRY